MSRRDAPSLPSSWEALARLQREFDAYQRQAFPVRPSEFFALELCGEAGELANLEKKAWKGRPVAAADFAEEAADVVIAVLNYANTRGIDLAERVREKMARIESRRRADPATA